jgi:hypothetical protein
MKGLLLELIRLSAAIKSNVTYTAALVSDCYFNDGSTMLSIVFG